MRDDGQDSGLRGRDSTLDRAAAFNAPLEADPKT